MALAAETHRNGAEREKRVRDGGKEKGCSQGNEERKDGSVGGGVERR